jgi:hypothetical protein
MYPPSFVLIGNVLRVLQLLICGLRRVNRPVYEILLDVLRATRKECTLENIQGGTERGYKAFSFKRFNP